MQNDVGEESLCTSMLLLASRSYFGKATWLLKSNLQEGKGIVLHKRRKNDRKELEDAQAVLCFSNSTST